MPKMKTHSGAKKRFKVKKSGKSVKIKRGSANRSHILTKMAAGVKRHLRNPGRLIDAADVNAVLRMLRLR